MFKFKLTDGSVLTVELDLAKMQIRVTQSWPVSGAAPLRPPQELAVPFADVKQLVKQAQQVRAYFS